MSEIDVYKGQNPIDYIVKGSANIPTTYSVPGDTLGLAEHGHVRAAFATLTYGRFDEVCSDIIVANPIVRKQFMTDDELVEVGTVSVGSLHSFSVYRHTQTSGGAQYTVSRCDIGTETGGFTIAKKGDGAVILTHNNDMRALDEDSDEYVQALGQITRFIEVLAAAHNLPVPVTSNAISSEDLKNRIKRIQKEENSLKNKAVRSARPVANIAVKMVTTEGKLGERKISYKKLAAIALIMVIPGYSERLIDDVPVPRPASVELASATAHALFDSDPPTPQQLATTEFRASNANLPDTAYLLDLGTAHDIAVVPDVGESIATYADQATVFIGQESAVITSLAPTRITIQGKLSPGECAVLGIDSTVQTGNYGIAGLTQQSIKGLQVSASRENLTICNTSSESIFTDDSVLYVDAK